MYLADISPLAARRSRFFLVQLTLQQCRLCRRHLRRFCATSVSFNGIEHVIRLALAWSGGWSLRRILWHEASCACMAEDHPDCSHEDDASATTSMSQTSHGADRKTGQPKIQVDWNQWLALRAAFNFELPALHPRASSRTDWSNRWRSGLHAGMHNDT